MKTKLDQQRMWSLFSLRHDHITVTPSDRTVSTKYCESVKNLFSNDNQNYAQQNL